MRCARSAADRPQAACSKTVDGALHAYIHDLLQRMHDKRDPGIARWSTIRPLRMDCSNTRLVNSVKISR
jgi:hypothetical protein